jgi:LemA protein
MQPFTLLIIVIVAIIGLVFLYYFRTQKRMRRMKIEMDKSWSDIELLLKQRQDELPRLIQTCRSYMSEGERSLESVRTARASLARAASLSEKARATTAIHEAVASLLAAAQRYPGLQRDNAFSQIQARIGEIEERIAERQELYNDDVSRFNASLAAFPGRIPARIANLQPRPLFLSPDQVDSRGAR